MIARNSAAVSATSRLRVGGGAAGDLRPRVLLVLRLPDFAGVRLADPVFLVPLFGAPAFPAPAFPAPVFPAPVFPAPLRAPVPLEERVPPEERGAPEEREPPEPLDVRFAPPPRDAPGGGIRTIGSGDSSL